MKNMKTLTLFLSMTFFLQIFAQDATCVYGPVQGINLDDMFAVASKTYQDNGVTTDKFNYSQGVIVSTSYKFTVLVSEFRADIEVKNTDNGAYISFVDMQMKGSSGWEDVTSVLGKKPNKLIKSIGEDFEKISKDSDEIKAAKKSFYDDPNTHYLFFKKATELAADRWYENFMKDKTFSWDLKFSDIKKNESKKFEAYKYVVTARYYPGSSLTGMGGLYVKLYTNSDDLAMAEKNSKVKIEGKCVGFKEYMGYYYIDFEQ